MFFALVWWDTKMEISDPCIHSRESLLRLIEVVREKNSLRLIFAPSVNFTTRVVALGQEDDPHTEWFVRTKGDADGGIVRGTATAVAIFNGDCPVICLSEDDRLALLHAGYRCLVREDQQEPNIIESVFRQELFTPRETRAWIGGGIGLCCWVPEYEDKPEIRKPETYRHPDLLRRCLTTTTARSPFGAGYHTVDLYALTRELLLQQGIPDAHIHWDTTCTCCARRENGDPAYWSHTRAKASGGTDGRNMFLAWLAEAPA